MSEEQPTTAYTSPRFTRIVPVDDEEKAETIVPPKVVSWDVAEEKEMDTLREEITEHKSKMKALEDKATQLQRQLDRKVALAETNISLGVQAPALEYKVVALHAQKGYEHFASLHHEPDCEDILVKMCWSIGCCSSISQVPKTKNALANDLYKEFTCETLKKLGQEGWTLRGVHTPGSMPIFNNYDPVWRSQVLFYFSRPL